MAVSSSTAAAGASAATSGAGTGALTAAGDAENAQTVATLIASIHEQGVAARTNAMAEGAKALATLHD